MPLSFMRDTAKRLRAPITVKNGMERRDWENADEKTLQNVQITAQSTSEEFAGRVTQSTTRRTFRAGYEADVKPGDRIIWNGDTYEIDGEVFHTKSPTGRVSSTRCTLVRWEG